MMRRATVLLAVVVLLIVTLTAPLLSFATAGSVSGKSAPFTLSSPVELQANLSGEVGYSVFQLADGSLILNTSNQTCTFLVKLDSSNQVLWAKPIQIDPTNTTLPRLRPTADGGFVLAGIMDNLYTVVKTDSDGNIHGRETTVREHQ